MYFYLLALCIITNIYFIVKAINLLRNIDINLVEPLNVFNQIVVRNIEFLLKFEFISKRILLILQSTTPSIKRRRSIMRFRNFSILLWYSISVSSCSSANAWRYSIVLPRPNSELFRRISSALTAWQDTFWSFRSFRISTKNKICNEYYIC